jgi:hypothetical protein
VADCVLIIFVHFCICLTLAFQGLKYWIPVGMQHMRRMRLVREEKISGQLDMRYHRWQEKETWGRLECERAYIHMIDAPSHNTTTNKSAHTCKIKSIHCFSSCLHLPTKVQRTTWPDYGTIGPTIEDMHLFPNSSSISNDRLCVCTSILEPIQHFIQPLMTAFL